MVSHATTQTSASYLQGAFYRGTSNSTGTLSDSGQASCTGHTCQWVSGLLTSREFPVGKGYREYLYAYGNHVIEAGGLTRAWRTSGGIYAEPANGPYRAAPSFNPPSFTATAR